MEYIIGTIVAAVMTFLVLCFVCLGQAVFRDVAKPSVTKHFEKYKHHGEGLVWVRADLRGRHRDHCLCFDCKRFHPGSAGNCPVAKTLYQLCIDHDLVTPVWECPRFKQDPFAAERKWNQ